MPKGKEDQIKTTVAVDGEKEYKQACKDIGAALKEMGSEMKLVAAQYADNANGIEALTKKQDILNRELEEQEKKIKAAEKALKELEDAGEGSGEAARRLRTELNRANATYANMERAVNAVADELQRSKSEYTQYEKAAKEVDDTLEDLGDELKLLDKQMRLSEDATDDMRKKQELLKKVLVEQEKKVKELEKAYEAAKRETGETSDKTDELRRALNNARGAIIDTQVEMKQLGEALEKAGNEAREAGQGFGDLGGMLGDLGGPFGEAADLLGGIQDKLGAIGIDISKLINPTTIGITGLGVALGSAVVSSVRFADEVQQALVNVQQQTGLTTDKMGKFKDVMMDLYSAGIGESVNDIADAMSKATQALGTMDKQALYDVTAGMLGLQDAFDMDFQESIRAASRLMDTFGADAEFAFDSIARAAQKGLNQNDNLLDTINEYAVHYQQLGLSMDDMFASLASAKEAGVFDLDKAGDAIKEFGIRVREGAAGAQAAFKTLGLDADEMIAKFNAGGPAAKEAFQQVIDALVSMDDQVKQNEVGLALFGTMWEDLGRDAIAEMGEMKTGLGEVKGAIDEINEANLSTIEGALNRLGNVGAETGEIAFGWLETWLPGVINAAADNLDKLNAKLKGEEVEEPDVSYYAALTGRTTLPNMNNGELWAQRFSHGMKEGEVAGPPKPEGLDENYYIEDLWASGALDEQKVSAQLEAIHKGIIEAGNQALEDAETIYGGLGKKALESYGASIAENGASVEQSVAEIMESVAALAAELMESEMPAAGEAGMTALAEGVTSSKPTVNAAIVSVVTEAARKATAEGQAGGTQAGATLAIAAASAVEVNAAGFYAATHQMATGGAEAVNSHTGEFSAGGAALVEAAAAGVSSAAGALQSAVDSAVAAAAASMAAGVAQLAAHVREAQALAAQMPSGSGSGSGGVTVVQNITGVQNTAKAAAKAVKDAVREVT